MATWKGLEPSTSSVTGWHSNQLNYQANNNFSEYLLVNIFSKVYLMDFLVIHY
jgi:hypothetical protein